MLPGCGTEQGRGDDRVASAVRQGACCAKLLLCNVRDKPGNSLLLVVRCSRSCLVWYAMFRSDEDRGASRWRAQMSCSRSSKSLRLLRCLPCSICIAAMLRSSQLLYMRPRAGSFFFFIVVPCLSKVLMSRSPSWPALRA